MNEYLESLIESGELLEGSHFESFAAFLCNRKPDVIAEFFAYLKRTKGDPFSDYYLEALRSHRFLDTAKLKLNTYYRYVSETGHTLASDLGLLTSDAPKNFVESQYNMHRVVRFFETNNFDPVAAFDLTVGRMTGEKAIDWWELRKEDFFKNHMDIAIKEVVTA